MTPIQATGNPAKEPSPNHQQYIRQPIQPAGSPIKIALQSYNPVRMRWESRRSNPRAASFRRIVLSESRHL